MSREDWYRNTDWTPEIQASFEQRLGRCRSPGSKCQYLRIQGLKLIETQDPGRVSAGIELTRRMLREHADERGEVAMCWCQIGDGLLTLDRLDEALDAYGKATAFERSFPYVRTQAPLNLAVWIARLDRRDRTAEALAVVSEPDSAEGMFPIVAAKREYVRAVLASWRGDRDAAVTHARNGLAAAAAVSSPLRYHRDLGLVSANDRLINELKLLEVDGSVPNGSTR